MTGEAAMSIYTNPAAALLTDPAKLLHVDYATEIYPSGDAGRQMGHTLGTSLRLSEKSAFLVGVRYLGGLSLEIDTPSGSNLPPHRTIRPTDLTVDLGYALRWNAKWISSISASYLYTHVDRSGHGVAFSLGTSYVDRIATGIGDIDLIAGLRLMDLGPKITMRLPGEKGTAYSLPSSAVAGGEVAYEFTPRHRLSFASSVRYIYLPDASDLIAAIGAEYTYARTLSLRAGVDLSPDSNKHLTVGVGAKKGAVGIDAAYLHALTPVTGVSTLMIGATLDL